MCKPIIGIPEMGKDKLFRIILRAQYPAAVKRAGGSVRWLPWTEDETVLKRYLAECDGLLFPGGADISPTFYGEEEDPARSYHRQRDAMELPLMRLAVQSSKPVLGICRGSQVMNVALGGSLYGDIKKLAGPEIHMAMKQAIKGSHEVVLSPASKLSAITGKTTLWVNTLHHQSVKDPSSRVEIVARSPHGIVEAIEVCGHPFCIGLQWHPELMFGNAEARMLFCAFVSKAQEGQNARL